MRNASVAIAAGLLALAFYGSANSQTPTGSISGRVVVEGAPNIVQSFQLLVVPVGLPQPVRTPKAFQYVVSTDTDGTFTAYELADGQYLVALFPGREGLEFVTPMPEALQLDLSRLRSLSPPEGQDQATLLSLPARRVRVSNGEAVTGVEIVIRLPPVPFVPGPGGAPVLPESGTGVSSAKGFVSYVALGVGALAVLSVAGGLGLRLLDGRRR